MDILIISGSPRKSGNTDLLVEAFVKGASQKHHVELVPVHDYKVNPCMGCNACFVSKDNTCVQKDDMAIIYEKMAHADMLVIASPVYFYGLSAQLKATIGLFVFHWMTGYFNTQVTAMTQANEMTAGLPGPIKYIIWAFSGTGHLWFIQDLWLFSIVISIRLMGKNGKVLK